MNTVAGIADEWVRSVHEFYCGPQCKIQNCDGLPDGTDLRILREVLQKAGL